ncbi:MAG: sensor histidine kinase, partial [Casimicrobiaceae bacterium]
RLTDGYAALNLPRVAQEMFEWDAEDRIQFRVEGSSSGLIAGVDLPMRREHEEVHQNVSFYDATVNGNAMRWVVLSSPLPPVGETVTISVGETTLKRDRLTEEILLTVWLPQIALLLVAGWIAYRTIYEQTESIHTLSTSLRDVSYRKLQRIPDGNMPAELQPLIDALNAMMDKLEAAALTHRKFIANAAHQLRTPLTAMGLQVHQAMHNAAPDDTQRTLRELHGSVQRATRVANQLLLLSRAEPEAQSGAVRSRIDLHQLAFEVASAWVPAALARSIDLGFDEASAHIDVEVDVTLVSEAINNLVDNAIKYAGAGASVTVAVQMRPDPAVVVEDTGAGIAVAERGRVIQRFYRGDSARSDGSGLGLAIVHEVALAHAGSFVIADAMGGGARFELHLPAA